VVTLTLVPSLLLRTAAISLPVPKGTFPTTINERDEVAGYCVDSIAVAHGFLRDAQGRVTVFEAPAAGPLQRQGTFVSDINNAGTIVGYYIDSKRVHHGFVRKPDGAFTTLDAPGAGAGMGPPIIGHPELRSGQGTLVTGVNDGGVVTGYFIDAKNVRHGFLRDESGAFITFDVAGAGSSGTAPESVNGTGQVTGTYRDPPIVVDNEEIHSYRSGAEHGFLREPKGTIKTFDKPSAGSELTGRTRLKTVNNSGTVVGSDEGENGTHRGFIRREQGAPITFEVSCEDKAIAITFVAPLIAGVTKTITISGRHFGSYPSAADTEGPYVVIEDSAPGRGCACDVPLGDLGDHCLDTVRVMRWTDTEVAVTGFAWPFKGPCLFQAGDRVNVEVWNTQTGAGPATCELTVGMR